MRTYAPITTDPGPDIARANSVAVVSILAGIVALLLSAIMAAVIGDMWPALVGAVLFVAALVFGVGASFYHTSAPMRHNLTEAQREAEHQREMERTRVDLERLMIERAPVAALPVPDSAWTRPVQIDGGKAVFAASVAPSGPSVTPDAVAIAPWGAVRLDLVHAIAMQWPNTSRKDLRESGRFTFENDEYRRAKGALADYLFGVDPVTRADVWAAVSRIRAGAPRPVAIPGPSEVGADAGYGRRTADGPTDGRLAAPVEVKP